MNPERFGIGLVLRFTQVDESEIKTARFGCVSGDFESGIKSRNFKSENFKSEILSCKRFFLETGYFSAFDILSLRWNENEWRITRS